MSTIFSTMTSPSNWLPKVNIPSVSNATFSTAGSWAKDTFIKVPKSIPGSHMVGNAASAAWANPLLTTVVLGLGLGVYKFLTNSFRPAVRETARKIIRKNSSPDNSTTTKNHSIKRRSFRSHVPDRNDLTETTSPFSKEEQAELQELKAKLEAELQELKTEHAAKIQEHRNKCEAALQAREQAQREELNPLIHALAKQILDMGGHKMMSSNLIERFFQRLSRDVPIRKHLCQCLDDTNKPQTLKGMLGEALVQNPDLIETFDKKYLSNLLEENS